MSCRYNPDSCSANTVVPVPSGLWTWKAGWSAVSMVTRRALWTCANDKTFAIDSGLYQTSQTFLTVPILFDTWYPPPFVSRYNGSSTSWMSVSKSWFQKIDTVELLSSST